MTPDGSGRSGVIIVAEALGANEAATGKPLVGPAGFMFGKIIQRQRIYRDDLLIANTVWCQPPGNALSGTPYQDLAIGHCRPNLDALIEKAQREIVGREHVVPTTVKKSRSGDDYVMPERRFFPKGIVLVAMGEIAANRLIQGGLPASITKARGYVFPGPFGTWVIPTLHPSYVMRGNSNLMGVVGYDIRHAMEIAQEGFSYDLPDDFLLDPSLDEFAAFVARYEETLARDSHWPLATDIETPTKKGDEDALDADDPTQTILRCSFAFGEDGQRTASIPWEPQYMPLVRRLLGGFGRKLFWNAGYDCPRLAAQLPLRGQIEDVMDKWKVYNSDVPMSLAFATPCLTPTVPYWKHESIYRPAFYNAVDSHVTFRNNAKLETLLVDTQQTEVVDKHIILAGKTTEGMSRRGLPVDPEAKALLKEALEQQLGILDSRIQSVVPEDLKPLHPKEGYKKEPKDKTDLFAMDLTVEVDMCSFCGKEQVTKSHFKKCMGEPVNAPLVVTRWFKRLPFTPSPQQLVEYALTKGYKVPKNHETKNFTMNAEALETLIGRYPEDPLFPLVGKFREIQKTLGTNVNGLPVGPDHRVHTEFLNRASTLRYASRNPNLQNIPQIGDPDDPNDLGRLIRRMVKALPGMTFWKRDYSAIEAVLVGWFAKDPTYIRMAKLGIHDYVASHVLGRPADLSWSDADLKAYFKEIKKHHKGIRDVSKRIVHLSNYLGTPMRIYMLNKHLFKDTKHAAQLQDFYFELFPKIRTWQADTVALADHQGYLRNPFNYIHWFWEPYTYTFVDGKWEKSEGPDAKRCVAFGPQSTAAGLMRDTLADLHDTPMEEHLLLTIHDEIFGMSPQGDAEAISATVAAMMERPNRHLPMPEEWGLGPFLSIATEGAFGPTWGDMN